MESLGELADKIEALLGQQSDRLAFHYNDTENDYRVQERRLADLMLDKSASDEKHLEYAREIIKRADAYKKDHIGPLQLLNKEINQHLLKFERVLRTVPRQPAVERWLSLSKELHQICVEATRGIDVQTKFNKYIPTLIINSNGRVDLNLSPEQSKEFHEGMTANYVLLKTCAEKHRRIQEEREPLPRQAFPVLPEVKTPETATPPARPTVVIHTREGKAWFRLLKVLYVGSWIVGLEISGIVAYGAHQFYIFVVGAGVVGIALIGIKKLFYYVVPGRSTATEKLGNEEVEPAGR
ncbi:MAG TPA: hypothetical protein VF748_04810 [Candidatus Acidoferrum sp.]